MRVKKPVYIVSWDDWLQLRAPEFVRTGVQKEQIQQWHEQLRELSFAACLILGVSKNWWSNGQDPSEVPIYWSVRKNAETGRFGLKPWTMEAEQLHSMLEHLDNKFAKLSYLFLEDFFVQKHERFLKTWFEATQKMDHAIMMMGPFNGKKQGLTAQETLSKINTGQVSALLALCQRMSKNTPQWLLDGLVKMEQHNLATINWEQITAQASQDVTSTDLESDSKVPSVGARYKSS